MIIGFTGTQSGLVQFQIDKVLEIFESSKITELLHGDCIGADEMANKLALNFGVKIFTIFPPDNPKKRAFCFDVNQLSKHLRQITPYTPHGNVQVRWMPIEPYLERNKRIVDSCNFLIACPKEHTHSVRSGTWSTIRYAWKVKKDLIIIPPIDRYDDGT